jgi:hypothetical protein
MVRNIKGNGLSYINYNVKGFIMINVFLFINVRNIQFYK